MQMQVFYSQIVRTHQIEYENNYNLDKPRF